MRVYHRYLSKASEVVSIEGENVAYSMRLHHGDKTRIIDLAAYDAIGVYKGSP